MLIAIIGGLFFLLGGGGTVDHYLLNIEEPVEIAVKDEQVREQVLELSESMEDTIADAYEDIEELRGDFLDFHQDYDGDVASLDPIKKELLAIRAETRKASLDARDAMKKLLTEEEWEKVFAK